MEHRHLPKEIKLHILSYYELCLDRYCHYLIQNDNVDCYPQNNNDDNVSDCDNHDDSHSSSMSLLPFNHYEDVDDYCGYTVSPPKRKKQRMTLWSYEEEKGEATELEYSPFRIHTQGLNSALVRLLYGYFVDRYFCEEAEVFLVFCNLKLSKNLYDMQGAIDLYTVTRLIPCSKQLVSLNFGGEMLSDSNLLNDKLINTIARCLPNSIRSLSLLNHEYVTGKAFDCQQSSSTNDREKSHTWDSLLALATCSTQDQCNMAELFPNLRSLVLLSKAVYLSRICIPDMLTSLDLSTARCSDEIWITLFQNEKLKRLTIMSEQMDLNQLPLIFYNDTLQYLKIKHCSCIQNPGRLIHIFRALIELDLSTCSISSDDMYGILSCAKEPLKKINFFSHSTLEECEGSFDQLYCDLESIQLPSSSAEFSMEYLTRSNIKELSIGSIQPQLLSHPSLRSLTHFTLTEVCFISQTMATILSSLPHLTHLTLSQQFENGAVEQILTSKTITHLSLSCCHITDHVLLSPEFETNKTLRFLDVSYNQITAAGFGKLLLDINKHNICELIMLGNPVWNLSKSVTDWFIDNNCILRLLIISPQDLQSQMVFAYLLRNCDSLEISLFRE